MFSKKVEKILLIVGIIFICIALLAFFIATVVILESNNEITLDNVYFQLIILTPICLLLFYFLVVKFIYLQCKILQTNKLIKKKSYNEISNLTTFLLNKNSNVITRSLYSISFVFNKDYEGFLNYYEKNKKRMNVDASVYYILTLFVLNQEISLNKINSVINICKFAFRRTEFLILTKLKSFITQNYNDSLSIRKNNKILNNEFYDYLFMLCEINSKKYLNIDTTKDEEYINLLYFNKKS